MRILRSVFAILAFATPILSVRAQQATVFVQHALKTGDEHPVLQRSYQLPGEDEKVRHAGVPALIAVPQGGVGCFRIERANPLLYTYSIGSKILKVETPDSIGLIMKQVLGLLPAAPLKGGAGFMGSVTEKNAVDPVVKYEEAVAQLFRTTTELEALKLSSDSAANLRDLASAGLGMAASAAAINTEADAAYDDLTDVVKKEPSRKMVRATQLAQADKAKRLAGEFQSVDALLAKDFCSGAIAGDRLHLSLSVAAKPGIPAENLKRIVGDDITSFDVEPVNNTQLDFGPGMIFNTLGKPSKTFAVEDGVIKQNEGEQLLFRPAIMANFRSWGPQWIWGTIGVSGSKEGVTDLFIGPTGRFGYQVAGARIAIGVGLAASKIPVGLSKGAVGEALPKDIDSLDKVVRKSLVPGFGVILIATGF